MGIYLPLIGCHVYLHNIKMTIGSCDQRPNAQQKHGTTVVISPTRDSNKKIINILLPIKNSRIFVYFFVKKTRYLNNLY